MNDYTVMISRWSGEMITQYYFIQINAPTPEQAKENVRAVMGKYALGRWEIEAVLKGFTGRVDVRV